MSRNELDLSQDELYMLATSTFEALFPYRPSEGSYDLDDWKHIVHLTRRFTKFTELLGKEDMEKIKTEIEAKHRRLGGDKIWDGFCFRIPDDMAEANTKEVNEKSFSNLLTPKYAGAHLADVATASFPEMDAETLSTALFFAGVTVAKGEAVSKIDSDRESSPEEQNERPF